MTTGFWQKAEYHLSLCPLGKFSGFFVICWFSQNQLFQKIISGIPSEYQTDWIQIRPEILSGLIWGQTVCKSYQQRTLGDKELSSCYVYELLLFPWTDSIKIGFWQKAEYRLTLCPLGNFFMLFWLSAYFFHNQLFRKILSGIPYEYQTDWIQIRPHISSSLIWVQTVCKSFQQTTLGDKSMICVWELLPFPWTDFMNCCYKIL